MKKLVLDLTYFVSEVQHSCLIEELIDKLTMTFKRPSLYSHDARDIEKVNQLCKIEKKESDKEFGFLKAKGLATNC